VTSGERIRATYEFRPVDHMYRTEFYIWPEAIERWKQEGMPEDWQERNLFEYDQPGMLGVGVNLGWTEPPFVPLFNEKVIESDGDIEIAQDSAGRHVKYFKGRRHGFMPEYVKHPVANMADWETVAPRLNPETMARYEGLREVVEKQKTEADAVGGMLSQGVIGGYMYLRALIGPEELMYTFYDQPDLVHAAMRTWLELVDSVLAHVQSIFDIDEIFIAEDICYNHGLLVSPDTVREYLFPYYQQMLSNARSRQKTHIYFHVDTDGDCRPAIALYSELGIAKMSPFEVASGCDVVEIGKAYPQLIISGGIDKRILAAGKDAIDKHLNHIIPFMLDRGGYYPTCDHGVPDDVSYENYLYYRRCVCELDNRN
jgi:hypothetical protein